MAQEFSGETREFTFLKPSYRGYLQSSAEAGEEGAEAYTYVSKDNGETKTAYRKKYRSTSLGQVTKFELKDSSFGKKLIIVLDCGDDGVDWLEIPMTNPKGQLSDFYKDLAAKMGSVEWGRMISFSPNTSRYKIGKDGQPRKRKDGSKILIPSLWINYEDKTSVPLKYRFAKKGQVGKNIIPQINWIEDYKGDKVADTTDQDKFLHEKMLEAIESFNQFKAGNQTHSAKKEVPTTESPVTQEQDNDEDDLPF